MHRSLAGLSVVISTLLNPPPISADFHTDHLPADGLEAASAAVLSPREGETPLEEVIQRLQSEPEIQDLNDAALQSPGCSTPFSGAFPVLGVQRTAVILINVSGGAPPQTADAIRNGMFLSEYSIAAFVDEVSYGLASLTGDVYGWFSMPDPGGCFFSPESAVYGLISSQVDLSSYDRFVFFVHGMTAVCAAGNSSLGKMSISTPQGVICASQCYIRGQPFYFPSDFSQTTQSTVAHELLHGFGVPFHSNAYLCQSAPLETVSSCEIGGYGDLFDMMGIRNQASHPNAILKEQLGWLVPSAIATWSPTQPTTQFTLLPLEGSGSTGTRAVHIPLDNPIQMATASGSNDLYIDALYLEFRDMTGVDYRPPFYRSIPTAEGAFEITSTHGVLIRGAECQANPFCLSYLLDMHASSIHPIYPPFEAADAYLYPGEQFLVPQNNILIRVLSAATGSSITVELSASTTGTHESDVPSSTYIRAIPNPTRGFASISFGLANAAVVTLEVFDVAGRRVRSVAKEWVAAGRHARSWDGRDESGSAVAAGIYVLRFRAGAELRTERIVVAR